MLLISEINVYLQLNLITMNKTTLFYMYSNLLAVGKIREMVDLGVICSRKVFKI